MRDTRRAVAIVRHSFYPFELNVKREAEALRDAGFAVHVICLRGKGEAPRESIDGVEVYRLPVDHKRGKILRYLYEYNAFFILAAFKLARLHRAHDFAAVQVNTMPDYLVYTAWYPKRKGAKVILHLHEPVPELFDTMFSGRRITKPFIWLLKKVEQDAIRFADRVLTVTEQMRDNYVRRGADPSKITVIVNVPDDRHFRFEKYQAIAERAEQARAERRQRGGFRVVTHGAIEERYGYDTVVRAIARARETIPGIEFRFMGGGDYLADVKRIAETVSVRERIEYLGFVPFDQMIEEILMADVCVVAVKKSPYSVLVHTNKMYEYMALRRPVIASQLDSVAAYAPEGSILFFEPGNDLDLSEKFIYAAQHPEQLEAQVERASQLYQKHRWDRERTAYLDGYGEFA
jgi:glycosyltransferase involved in cell wall biosynthesis